MKLKYKKIMLLTVISTMGIGILTLSLFDKNSQAKESMNPGTTVESLANGDNEDGNDSSIVTTSPSVSTAPSPTDLPVYNLQKDAYPEIKKLFQDFYKAKNDRDIEAIKKLLSDSTKVDSKEDIQKKTQYIESYDKITTYTKKGYAEGTYIVYVYHEIKFTGINTAAPGLSKFYVITDQSNKLKIFSEKMDKTVQTYFDSRNNDNDVKAIIDMTNELSDKAVKKDKDLQSFWKNIDKLANKAAGNSEVPTKSPTKVPTKAPGNN